VPPEELELLEDELLDELELVETPDELDELDETPDELDELGGVITPLDEPPDELDELLEGGVVTPLEDELDELDELPGTGYTVTVDSRAPPLPPQPTVTIAAATSAIRFLNM